MSTNTKIEWCDHTFNPWTGCTKVSPGCDHCYAEGWSKRAGAKVGKWGPDAPRVRTTPQNWKLPLRWNDQHEAFFAEHLRRQRVFCASLADVFDNAVPVQWRRDLFDLIQATPHLDWLLLTKRIGNARSMYAGAYLDSARPWPENVWLGATITSQPEADRDVTKLLDVPARVRFLSMEPLLGPVDLRELSYADGEVNALEPGQWETEIEQWRDTSPDWVEDFEDWYGVTLSDGLSGPMHAALDWVIVGGESGPDARPMHPDWASSLRDQCTVAGVPFLFKQWGEWRPISQMSEAEDRALWRSRKAAKPHEDQGNLDDIYGRMCTVDSTVMHLDGSMHHIHEPNAFPAGAMTMYRVGKKSAGRHLDGAAWSEFPETEPERGQP